MHGRCFIQSGVFGAPLPAAARVPSGNDCAARESGMLNQNMWITNGVPRNVTPRLGMLNSLLLASFCRLFRRGQVRGDLAAHCGQAGGGSFSAGVFRETGPIAGKPWLRA